MRIDQVNWITAHNYGEPKWHLFSPSLSWQGKIVGLNIASQNGPRKQTTEPKLMILVSFFSGEITSYTEYQLLHPHTVGSILFCFFLVHPVY